MGISLFSNISSLTSQRYLANATNALDTTSERLSSGLRINRASDDAAGLAIATSLNTTSRVFTKSIQNINDGISALAIADGATSNLTSIVTRLRELATQSANGTLGAFQRNSINLEAQALRDEYNRTISTTKFNGINLLDQRTGSIRLEAGDTGNSAALYLNSSNLGVGKWGDGTFGTASNYNTLSSIASTSDVAIGDFNGDGIQDMASYSNRLLIAMGNGDGSFLAPTTISTTGNSLATGDVNGDGTADIVQGTATGFLVFLSNSNGSFKGPATYSTPGGTSLSQITLRDLNNDGNLDVIGVNTGTNSVNTFLGSASGTFQTGASYAVPTGGVSSFAISDFNHDGKLDLAVTSSGTSLNILLGNTDGSFAAAVSFDSAVTASAGITVGDFNGDGNMDLLTANNTSFGVIFGNSDGSFNAGTSFLSGGFVGNNVTSGDINGDGSPDMVFGSAIFLSNGNGTFRYATGTANAKKTNLTDINNDGVLDFIVVDSAALHGGVNISIGNGNAVSYLNNFNLSTRSSSLAAITMLNNAQSSLSAGVGEIGSEQSRLNIALSNLNTMRENYLGAASRITDADMASEAADYTRFKILQQVGAAVLAQANQAPQLALLLLRS